MIINFSPMRRDDSLTVLRSGDALILNGVTVPLLNYAEGDNPWIVGQPELVEGDWVVSLILPHGAEATTAELFPEPVIVTQDGPIAPHSD